MSDQYWEEQPVEEAPGSTLARAMADSQAMADKYGGEIMGFIVVGVIRWQEDGRLREGTDVTFSPSISHAHGIGVMDITREWWTNPPRSDDGSGS